MAQLISPSHCRAGFDPHGFLDYIARLQGGSPPRSKEYSSLPALPIRLGILREAIARAGEIHLQPTTGAFLAIQDEARRALVEAARAEAAQPTPSLTHPKQRWAYWQ